MCGIGGIFHFDRSPVDPAAAAAMSAQLQHRGPDEGDCQPFPGGRAGASPAVDHRPRGFAPAHGFGSWRSDDRLQRRDPELSRAPRLDPLPLLHPGRHRDDPRRAPPPRRRRTAALQGAVRLRPARLGHRDRDARPRPARDPAVVLLPGRARPRLRLRDTGADRRPAEGSGARRGRAARVPLQAVRLGAPDPSQGRPQGASRHRSRLPQRRHTSRGELLDPVGDHP